MDDGCSPTVGILIFAGFVILDFVVFGFIAARKTAVRDFCGAIRIRMNDIRMSANWWF